MKVEMKVKVKVKVEMRTSHLFAVGACTALLAGLNVFQQSFDRTTVLSSRFFGRHTETSRRSTLR